MKSQEKKQTWYRDGKEWMQWWGGKSEKGPRTKPKEQGVYRYLLKDDQLSGKGSVSA